MSFLKVTHHLGDTKVNNAYLPHVGIACFLDSMQSDLVRFQAMWKSPETQFKF